MRAITLPRHTRDSMTLQIPYGEAWLLERLALYRLPVWGLGRSEHAIRDWLNRGFHNLSPADLRRTLRRLFDARDIAAFDEDDEAAFNPTDDQLMAALRRQNKTLYCGATEQGGMRWESLATPDWNRFFTDCGWNGECVEITAGSHERLIEIVNGSVILWRVSMDAASLDVECVRPWQALAWKSLPSGFRAIVPYTDNWQPKSREEAAAEHKKTCPRQVTLRTWATSICGHAYV